MASSTSTTSRIRFLALKYDPKDPDTSARQLILALRPEWGTSDGKIEFVRFTDGITNTLLKAVNKKEGLSKAEIDREAILLRAYGNGTDLIIDRQRETQNHELLMQYGLAPELLARFENGMLYRFIRGTVTRPEDLRRPEISVSIARRLAQWHAVVPCIASRRQPDSSACASSTGTSTTSTTSTDEIKTSKPEPNVWTVMQKWIHALPTETEAQQQRRSVLQKELEQLVADLSERPGLGKDGLVFSHNDLLSGNVIVQPAKGDSNGGVEVAFIDYEYAVPAPAAFDIANHFAEWGGFDCDMAVLPTVSQRRRFTEAYMGTYASLSSDSIDVQAETAKLMAEVDVFRGAPGFYWGIWALIQAMISQIDFDYASYAETRLAEYWAWKAEVTGTRATSGAEKPLRERRWAQETDDGGHL